MVPHGQLKLLKQACACSPAFDAFEGRLPSWEDGRSALRDGSGAQKSALSAKFYGTFINNCTMCVNQCLVPQTRTNLLQIRRRRESRIACRGNYRRAIVASIST